MLQLIYASAAVRNYTGAALKPLLCAARKANARRGISGMLVYHARSFLQVLEGPDMEVDALFETIRSDPRHTAVRLIVRSTIEEKQFEHWSMGFVDDAKKGPDVDGFVDFAGGQILSFDQVRAKKVLKRFQGGAWRRLADRGGISPSPYASNIIPS
jgi:hypothetical protein